MKIKRIFSWLLIVVLCFTLISCQDAPLPETNEVGTTASAIVTVTTEDASEPREYAPLLYRVTDKDGNVAWLFGSIHLGREDYYPLPDYVLNAFDAADSLAVEADIIAFQEDAKASQEAAQLMLLKDGTTVQDHVPAELYEKAVKILKDTDNYLEAFEKFIPYFWSTYIDEVAYYDTILEGLGADKDLGIDMHLLERAKNANKEILEVESVQFQYQLLTGFSYELQCMLLSSSIEMYEKQEEAIEEYKKMMDLWAAGDEKAFADYLSSADDELPPEAMELYEEYNNAIIVKRNLSMADFAEDALASGDEVFICVGAAHVVGEGAMADLLSARGYTVELITK